MTDMHPNWQATDSSADEQPLPVHVAEKPKLHPTPAWEPVHQPRVRRLSRQPAAIAGMLLAISIGFSLFFRLDRGSEVTVRITEQGFSPHSITVTAGGVIRWINESGRTQVLQSDAPCTANDQCLSARSIAAEDSATLTITPDFNAGTYGYYSITARDMEASFTVLSDNTESKSVSMNSDTQQNLAQTVPFGNASQSSAPPAGSAQSASVVSQADTMAFALPQDDAGEFVDITSLFTDNAGSADDSFALPDDATPSGSSSFSSRNTGGGAPLPINPYTVNGTRTHPFDAAGNPVTAGGNSSSSKGRLHGGAPRPIAQPSTGPALWITLMGSFGLLFLATRHLMKRTYVE